MLCAEPTITQCGHLFWCVVDTARTHALGTALTPCSCCVLRVACSRFAFAFCFSWACLYRVCPLCLRAGMCSEACIVLTVILYVVATWWWWWQWLESGHNECPVCKAGVAQDNVIPLYGRGRKQRTRDAIPPRPAGHRPEPVPREHVRGRCRFVVGVLGDDARFVMLWLCCQPHAQGFHRGAPAAQFGGLTFSAGVGFFPSLFGLQFVRSAPAVSHTRAPRLRRCRVSAASVPSPHHWSRCYARRTASSLLVQGAHRRCDVGARDSVVLLGRCAHVPV